MNSSTSALTLPVFGLSSKPRVSANSAALASSIWRCWLSQASYCVCNRSVKRERVLERNMLEKAFPLANFARTLPFANVTSKVLWLTWILPLTGFSSPVPRKWFLKETSAMRLTLCMDMVVLLLQGVSLAVHVAYPQPWAKVTESDEWLVVSDEWLVVSG